MDAVRAVVQEYLAQLQPNRLPFAVQVAVAVESDPGSNC